jgi:outer membrane autotransporter protein
MPYGFARHYLAIAIATALVPLTAQASTVLDVSNAGENILTESYEGDLQLVGSFTSNEDATTVLLGTVEGSLINNADMSLDGTRSGISDGTLYLEAGSHVGGDVVNNANLVTSNIRDVNVWIHSQVDGRFINNGLIQQSHPRYSGMPAVSIYESDILGGVVNAGTISASGPDTIALEIENSYLGGLGNSGQIQASGSNSIGLLVRDDVVLENDRIDNTGTISAKGASAVAVRIENDATLENFGTIRSDSVAVEMTDFFARTTQHAGLIEAPVAFRGNGNQSLHLSGGTVRGDLENLWTVWADGRSTLDAARIDAGALGINEGRLTLSHPHGTLSGSLILGETGELDLMLNTRTDTARPYLDVQGSVFVETGASVLVTPTPNDFRLAGAQRYQLVQADQWYRLNTQLLDTALTPDDLRIASTSGLLQINSYSLENGILSAVVAPLQGDAAARLVAGEGASLNAQNAIAAFSERVWLMDGDDPVFVALANGRAPQTARVAEQLYPEANGASPLGALDALRRFEGAVLGRAAEGSRKEGASPWIQAIGSSLKTGSRQGVRGFDLDNRGVAIGVDWGIGNQAVAGIAYGHYQGDTSHSNGNKLESQGHLLGLYGHYQSDGFFVTANMTYGWIEDEHRRYIAGTRAKGTGDGREFGTSLMAGYRFALQPGVTLEPRVAARYAEVRLDGYSEKGSSAALHVDSRRYQSGELGAGLKLAGEYSLGTGTLVPEATLMGWYDNVGDRTSVSSRFLNGGPEFATRGVVPGRDSYEGFLGLSYRIGDLSLGAGYSYTLRNDANAHSTQAMVSYSF